MRKVLIIGYGVVGQNMHKLFKNASIADPPKGFTINEEERFDVAFVCVPTEKKADGTCDTSIVERVIVDYAENVDIFCIKSTVPPETTKKIGSDYYVKVVFSPEYFGETIHANGADYNFLILGGKRTYASVVAEAYKEISHSSLEIIFTSSRTAELCKYMENCWLAAKVTFCNEFARISSMIGVDYNELRELWLKDPRINRSHTFVYKDNPYYSSHCLNKDIPALIAFAESVGGDPSLMRSVFQTNEKHMND